MAVLLHRRFHIVIAIGYLASLAAYSALPLFTRPFIAFLLPTTAAVIYALVRRVWARDPIRDDDQRFEDGYDAIFFAVILFIVTLHLMMIAALTGLVPPNRVLLLRTTLVLVGLVMVRIGNLLPRTRPNLVIGIRTWRTLGDRRMWMSLHRTAGYVVVLLGAIVSASGAFLSRPQMAGVLNTSVLAAMVVILTSYRLYSHSPATRG
jgi:uncharacterized membrane protein